MVALMVAVLTGFQEGKPPEKPARDEYPKWTYGGVFATDLSVLFADRHARNTMPQEGMMGEFHLTGTLHVSKPLRVKMSACYSCHSLELEEAYADYELTEAFTLRLGRFYAPFGAFSERVHATQLESASKPLPYIMGWMPRQVEFNQGILPAPAVDNGLSVHGNAWLSSSLQLGYEAALLRGLVGASPSFDFIQSRDFEDNNGEPAGAARVTASFGSFTLGASGMAGHYDPDHELTYVAGGFDLHVQGGTWNLRLELVHLKSQFLDGQLDEEWSARMGYVAQLDASVSDRIRVFILHDALRVEDLFLGAGGPQVTRTAATTDDGNTIYRFAAGLVYSLRPGLLLKPSLESWNFSDFKDTWVLHFSVVARF